MSFCEFINGTYLPNLSLLCIYFSFYQLLLSLLTSLHFKLKIIVLTFILQPSISRTLNKEKQEKVIKTLYLRLPQCFFLNSIVTSSPIRTNGAQYFGAE